MTEEPGGAPRQTLAQRLAERNRQRALRAERLARLRAPDPDAPDGRSRAADAAEAALEDFLRALTGGQAAVPAGPPVEPGEVLRFPRPETPPAAAAAPSDLERLPGVGPGLVWALERAGVRRLADLAELAPAELARRLGPLGRLVPAEAWIARARREAAPA
jgi:predicted flap endonuclease-1-like 5' DNA nuclease